jgi:hydrogenase nickel incorporation protein HypB
MKRVPLRQKVLKENDRIARELRERFRDERTLTLNLISSPGSGKTSLLEKTLERLGDELEVAVLTGDIATENDTKRLEPFGIARQITTGGACHLDAKMVQRGLDELAARRLDLLLIENVGNLICPAGFDLGEHAKVVILSVTEGDDKPLKYPNIFVRSDLMILNKIDLLPHVPFDVDAVRDNARRVHPGIEMLETSCTTGEGIERWLDWLRRRTLAIREEAVTG